MIITHFVLAVHAAKFDAPTITAYHRSIMKDMLKILEPLQQATDIGLGIHLTTMNSRHNNNFINALRTSFEKRFMTVYEDNDISRLASCLDRWCQDASQWKAAAVTCTLAPNKEYSTVSSSVKKQSKLFSFMSESTTQPSSVMNELNQYLGEVPLAEESDPLEYWKGHLLIYPNLCQLAVKYLTIMASSAFVQRSFSIAGKVFRLDRCHLTTKTLRML